MMRRRIPDAPRMDLLGMRAISKSMRKLDQEPPSGKRLFRLAILGDLVSNSLYYSLVGLGEGGRNAWLRGSLLGLAAGTGAVILPSSLGLGAAPSRRTPSTQLLTVLLYLSGGLAAAAVYDVWSKNQG
jgi:hypothetical protein